jgi:hypothetical protein
MVSSPRHPLGLDRIACRDKLEQALRFVLVKALDQVPEGEDGGVRPRVAVLVLRCGAERGYVDIVVTFDKELKRVFVKRFTAF